MERSLGGGECARFRPPQHLHIIHAEAAQNCRTLIKLCSDVLRRHYQSCKSVQNADNATVEVTRGINRACSSCKHSKLKCSGGHPCERCRSLRQSELCHISYRKFRLPSASDSLKTPSPAMSEPGRYSLSPGKAQHDQQPQNLPARQELDAIITPVNREVRILSVPQEFPGQLDCDQIQRSIVVPRQLPSEPLTIDGPNSTSLTDVFSTEPALDLMGVSTDTFFNLDLLDWSILDNSFVAHREDNGTVVTCSESSNQQVISPEATTSPYDFGDCAGRFVTPVNLPSGMSLMQISPLEAHCSHILQYLREASQGSRRWDHWFSMDNMSRFLRSYFESFHQHTPLLHLPFWNISITSTRLIFAMALMGAIYSGDLKGNSSDATRLCHMAQAFAWSSDPCLQAGGPAQLDTIHAVYIVTLLEAFYIPFKRYRAPVDTKRLVNEARNSGVFVDVQSSIDPWKMKWEDWSAQECRTR